MKPDIIGGELFIRRLVKGSSKTLPPQDAVNAIRAEIEAKRQEHAAALESWGAARDAYRAALLTEGGCFAARQGAISTERDVHTLANVIKTLESELAEVSRLDAEFRARQLMQAGAATLSAALTPYSNLEKFA